MAYMPKYIRISNSLRKLIQANKIKNFPSEKQLSRSYKVSRTTIRKSLQLLKEDHIIQSHAGTSTKIIMQDTNLNALSPRNNNCQTIGLVMAGFTDNYGADMLKAIQSYAWKIGYFIIIRFSNQSVHDEAIFIKQLIDFGVAGLLVFPVANYSKHAELLESDIRRIPTVVLDRQLEDLSLPIVSTNNYQAAKTITKSLLKMGHVNTVFMLQQGSNNSAMNDRIRGIKDAYHEYQRLVHPDSWLFLDTPEIATEEYYEKFQKSFSSIRHRLMFNKKFTCYMALDFSSANAFIIARDSLLKATPKVSFLGFDGPNYATTDLKYNRIVQDEEEIAHQAIKLLKKLIAGSRPQLTSISIDPKYIDTHSVFSNK